MVGFCFESMILRPFCFNSFKRNWWHEPCRKLPPWWGAARAWKEGPKRSRPPWIWQTHGVKRLWAFGQTQCQINNWRNVGCWVDFQWSRWYGTCIMFMQFLFNMFPKTCWVSVSRTCHMEQLSLFFFSSFLDDGTTRIGRSKKHQFTVDVCLLKHEAVSPRKVGEDIIPNSLGTWWSWANLCHGATVDDWITFGEGMRRKPPSHGIGVATFGGNRCARKDGDWLV